jgi:tetratricopeptide (TPR) repeat protein
MRNLLIVLGLSTALVSAGCFGRATTDANQNSNSATDVSQYTDANVALTEGSNFLDTGETDKAIDALGQAVKINPDLGEAWFKLGIAYALAEKRDETARRRVTKLLHPIRSRRRRIRKKHSRKRRRVQEDHVAE